MSESPYKLVNDVLNRIKSETTDKIRQKYEKKKKEDAYWSDVKSGAESWSKLLGSPEYTAAWKFLTELKKQLQDKQTQVLTCNFMGYSRDYRSDLAAVIASQISIIDMLMNEPERVIELAKER